MLEDLSIGKILLILLVIVILFGAKKIPDLAQGLGKGIREFKKAINDDENDINKSGTSDKKEDSK
jgi:sec-independent protein translocase protein TatA